MHQKTKTLRYRLVAVIAILAVYLHHVGMHFNGNSYHIMSAESSEALDDIMVFFERIRLPLVYRKPVLHFDGLYSLDSFSSLRAICPASGLDRKMRRYPVRYPFMGDSLDFG